MTHNSIALNKDSIGISVSVYLFKDGNAFVAYCPSLDLSGYDMTEEKAKADFEYVLHEWLEEQVGNGTLQEDLTRHGWKLGENGGKEPSAHDMISWGGDASRVFSIPDYRKTSVCAEVCCQ